MAVLPNLSDRILTAEVMDDPALAPDQHRRALAGLARLNRVAGSARLLWPALELAARRSGARDLRVLDLATGSGDLPIALMKRAQRHGIPLDIDGCDVSPRAIEDARKRAAKAGIPEREARDAGPRFFTLDVLQDEVPSGYDAVMCSLFMHHLQDEQVISLLYKMRCAAGSLVLVSDLERRRDGLVMAWSASRILTRSEVVHTDALLSVRAAYTMGEFADLAVAAGLETARISRRWPCRFVLEWHRPAGK